MTELERWVAALVADRYETAGRLAKLIDMSDSAFSRGVRNGTLGIESLLKLARETGESPDVVLRMAGKAAVADLLADLYGNQTVRPSARELRVIQAYRALPKDAQAHWLGMAETHPGRAGAATARAAG